MAEQPEKPKRGPSRLDRIRRTVDHFAQRKLRARERLERIKGSWWCFALLGFSMEPTEHELDDAIIIREVEEPPGEVELAEVLEVPARFSTIARYSHSIRYELAVAVSDKRSDPFTLAWWVVSAIRAKTLAEIIVPVAANLSWSAIAGADPKSVRTSMIEDVPAAFMLDSAVVISKPDLQWVVDHLVRFADLLEVPSFRLAVEALNTHHQQASLRMVTAALWSGIEALFGVQQELRFRLAAYIASFLEKPGSQRLAFFRKLLKDYDFRSRAVHGLPMRDRDLEDHIRSTRVVLSRLLCRMIELGRHHSAEEFDGILFGLGPSLG